MFEAVGTMCTKKARGGKKQGLLGSSARWGRESEAAGGTSIHGLARTPEESKKRRGQAQGETGG